MKCPRCGMESKDDDKICKYCGAILSEKAPEPSGYTAHQHLQSPHVRAPRKPSKFEKAVSALLHVFLYVMLFFGIQVLVTAAYMTACMMNYGITAVDEASMNLIIQKTTENQVLIMLVSNLITLLVVCLLQTFRGRSVKGEIGLRRVNFMRVPTFALFGIALNVFVSCTISYLPIPTDLVESFDSHYSSLFGGESLLLQILSVAVVTGIVEEIIFRGIIISRLGRGFGTAVSVVLSALVFGFVHGTPIAIVYATVLGIIFGIMYIMYDSIVPSMACHIGFNLTAYMLGNIPIEPAYVASIVLILFFAYRIFIRRPTFSDLLSDVDGKIRGKTEEEAKLFDEIRALRTKEGLTPDDLDRMSDEFDRVMSRRKGRRNK